MRTMSSTAPSTVAAPASPAARRLPPRVARLVLFALAMGGFAIGTSEFAIMGLMPEIARGLGIDEPQVGHVISAYALGVVVGAPLLAILGARSEEHTSELQSLMRISYAVFCLKKKNIRSKCSHST